MSFSLTVKSLRDGKQKSYTITQRQANDGYEYWLDNELAEGMSLSTQNLFDIFDKEFKDNF